ncbi:porin [Enterobacteriaceae bacterium G50]|nr:porin [Enterobacteriaceae bacterium G50]
MKRKVLAIIVPALLVAGAANAAEIYNKDGNKLDLYGKVDARHTFSDNPGDDGDESIVELGFRGETQITPELTGYGQALGKMIANDTESAGGNGYMKLAFAGLKYADAGSFDYGRNYGVVYDVEAWTDMLPVFGGDSYTWTDNYMTGRANGVATYRNTDFFGQVEGLNFALQYQGNNESGGTDDGQNEGTKNRHDGDDFRLDNGDGFGISTTYDFGDVLEGLSVGAAYSSSDRTNDQVAAGTIHNRYSKYAGGDEAEAWTIGMKYDGAVSGTNGAYLALMYAETRNMTPYGNDGIANKTQNFEAVAQYQFDFGLRPSLAWVYSKGKDMGGYDGFNGQHHVTEYTDKTLVNYISVAATYYFNKNMSAYVDYKINMLDNDVEFYHDNGISTDDVVGVGLTYQF